MIKKSLYIYLIENISYVYNKIWQKICYCSYIIIIYIINDVLIIILF